MTNLVSCGMCKYYCSEKGECRVCPPQQLMFLNGTNGTVYTHYQNAWPKVMTDDWCGNWDAGKVGS
jgi:hypothetical protein